MFWVVLFGGLDRLSSLVCFECHQCGDGDVQAYLNQVKLGHSAAGGFKNILSIQGCNVELIIFLFTRIMPVRCTGAVSFCPRLQPCTCLQLMSVISDCHLPPYKRWRHCCLDHVAGFRPQHWRKVARWLLFKKNQFTPRPQ